MNTEFKKIIDKGKELIQKLKSDGYSSIEKDVFEDAIEEFEEKNSDGFGRVY